MDLFHSPLGACLAGIFPSLILGTYDRPLQPGPAVGVRSPQKLLLAFSLVLSCDPGLVMLLQGGPLRSFPRSTQYLRRGRAPRRCLSSSYLLDVALLAAVGASEVLVVAVVVGFPVGLAAV